ncbi:MAG: GGDEF domain-containing protein, partial [Firmicutes bacterium]|nr:GGDEF domain-containing protein [Bacillota bacterium]
MRVLIISGAPEGITGYLASVGHDVKECLSTDLAPRMAGEFAPEAVIFSEDVAEIPPVGHREALREIVPLARVVLLAGRKNPIVPYAAALGVRDFVFLPAGPAEILHRLENPAKPEEAAEMLDKFDLQTKEEKQIAVQKEDKESHKTGLLGRAFGKKNQENDREGILKEETPDIEKTILYKSVTPQNSKPGISRLLGKLITHGKPGIIVNGNYIEGSWKTPAEINAECDAVVIPSSWGIKAVREFRRDPRFRAVPLVVLKGNKEFLRAGADMCIKKLNPGVIEEATALSRRYREFWKKAEIDSMTGLFKKDFLLEWIAEQERKPEPNFSIAMIDIDHFKSFNDTYGHQAGDAVLASFGAFLKAQIRSVDVAARYGGEEFVIGLPNTPVNGAQVLIDRLREKWSQRDIILPSGEKVKCTFSAGVAGYEKGKDIIAEADRFLYKAKSEGRNRVAGAQFQKLKVLLLGQKVSSLGPLLLEQGLEVATDPADATVVVADAQGFGFAPPGKPLVVLGTGTIADFAIRKSRPDAKVVKDPENVIEALLEMLEKPKPMKNLKVLPGGHSDRGQSLALHSALYIVCPSRPGHAGEVAARLARDIEDCALVCAAPESTAALVLGISERELITSDWRIPGSNAPLGWGGITVWPVDPLKFLNVRDVSPNALVESIKPKFPLVIVDCAGSLDIAGRVSRSDGIVVLH